MSTNKKIRTGQTGYEPNTQKRTHLFKVFLSEEEYQQLEKEALASGSSSLAKYARQVLFSGNHAKQQQADFERQKHLELLAAMNRIGNNINQIARALNQRQQMTPDIHKTLAGLKEKLNLLVENTAHAGGRI